MLRTSDLNLVIKAAHFAAFKHRNQRRKRKYFDWANEVIDALRGTHRKLERLFDEAFARRP